MNKQYKILTVLLVVAITAVLYLVISVKPVDNVKEKIGKEPRKSEKVELAEMENAYKKEVETIYGDYLAWIDNDGARGYRLKRIKERLLDLKVPTKFKDLHLDFVMAIVKMENFLENGKKEDKDASQELINNIKTDYAWLN